MRGLGVSFLLRRARVSWLLLACVAVTVLLATGLAALLWTFAGAVVPFGAQSFLADPQDRVLAINGPVNAREAAADTQQIRAALRRAWPEIGFQLESALWTEQLQLPSPGNPTAIRQIQLASLAGISAQVTLTAGTWPGPPHRGGPVPAAVPAAVASQLHLTVGSVLTGTPISGGAATSLQVTGLFRANDPASPYWALDLLPVSGMSVQRYSASYAESSASSSTTSYGPAVVNPAAFGGALTVRQASWMVLPQASALARGNLEALSTGTSAAVTQLNELLPEGLTVTSGLPQILAGIASTIVLTRSLFTIAALLLLLVAGAALVLAARLLAGLREEESALLRARGATRWQVVRPVLAEAVLVGAAAGLAGVLAGTSVTGALARLANLHLAGSSLADLRLVGYTGHGIAPLAWLSALAMVVVCAAVMTWPALHAPAPDAARIRRGRQARLAGIAWAGGDLALVALAAVAVWELHGYSAVAHPATGSLGIDPVVALAPVLALAGVAIIPLRGLPLLATLADKATDGGRRLAAAMVSWQIARRPIRQAGPALLVVVAAATTTLALAGYASWRQSAADQAAFAVGSDVRVDAAAQLPLGATGAITRAPGVTAATSASLYSIANGAQLIALDASTAGKTILLRPDLSSLPASALWQRITPRPTPGLVLPGQPERLEVLASLGAAPGTSAAEVARDLGSVTVMAWVADAGGAIYQIPAAGLLPADGRTHALVVTLSGPGQASYPLRLVGLTLTYVLPPYDPANPQSAPVAHLSIESLAMAETASGPFGQPFSHGAALAAWQGGGFSRYVPAGPPNFGGPPPPSSGAAPATEGWTRAAGGGLRLTFNAGHDPSAQVQREYQLRSRDRHRDGHGYRAAALPGRPGHRHRRLPGGQPARRRIDRLGNGQLNHGSLPDRGVGGRLPDRLRAEPGADRRPPGGQRPARRRPGDARRPPGDAPAGDPLVAAHRGRPGAAVARRTRPVRHRPRQPAGGPARQPAADGSPAGPAGHRGGGGAARRGRVFDQRRGQPPLAADAERGVRRARGGEERPGRSAVPGTGRAQPSGRGRGSAGRDRPGSAAGTRDHPDRGCGGAGAVGAGGRATRPGRCLGPGHRGRAGRRRGPVGPAPTRPGGAVAGGGRMRTLRLRLRAGWVTLTGTGAAATVAFGLLVFVAVLASLAIPRESVALRTGALQRVIAASPLADRTVVGTVARDVHGGRRQSPSRRSAPPCGRRWRRPMCRWPATRSSGPA